MKAIRPVIVDGEPLNIGQRTDIVTRTVVGGPRGTKAVLFVLHQFAGPVDEAFPSQATIARYAEMGHRTAQKALAHLREIGAIEVLDGPDGRPRRRMSTLIYRINYQRLEDIRRRQRTDPDWVPSGMEESEVRTGGAPEVRTSGAAQARDMVRLSGAPADEPCAGAAHLEGDGAPERRLGAPQRRLRCAGAAHINIIQTCDDEKPAGGGGESAESEAGGDEIPDANLRERPSLLDAIPGAANRRDRIRAQAEAGAIRSREVAEAKRELTAIGIDRHMLDRAWAAAGSLDRVLEVVDLVRAKDAAGEIGSPGGYAWTLLTSPEPA